MGARDLAEFIADLANFNDGVTRARRAHLRNLAQHDEDDARAATERWCACGRHVLGPRRKKCDECSADTERQRNQRRQAVLRAARKAKP